MDLRHAASDRHPIPAETEAVATDVVEAAFRVHRGLGPGLLESVYQTCLGRVLQKQGRRFVAKPRLAVEFEGEILEAGMEPDFIVEDRVIIELKTVETLHPVHAAQVLTYLKLSGINVGYLINFNVPRMHQGVKRFIMTGGPPSRDTSGP